MEGAGGDSRQRERQVQRLGKRQSLGRGKRGSCPSAFTVGSYTVSKRQCRNEPSHSGPLLHCVIYERPFDL